MKSLRAPALTLARRTVTALAPAKTLLPLMYRLHRLDGTCEPELLHLDEIGGHSGVAVDVGANFGWYTYLLAKRYKRVYAFEINDDVTNWIERYKFRNVELHHCGLSSAAGRSRFYVPVIRKMILTGWGSLDRDNLKGADEYREKEVFLARLDDFGIRDIGFMKIDVEGHEVEVLRGASTSIAQSRPVLLIEVRDQNLDAADSFLANLDYQRFRLETLIGVAGSRENYIYLPGELVAKKRLGKAAESAWPQAPREPAELVSRARRVRRNLEKE
jgi:FkbM family methyltransferase